MWSSSILSLLKSAFLKSSFSVLLFSLLSFKRIMDTSVSCSHKFSSTLTFSSTSHSAQGCYRLYSNLSSCFPYFLYQGCHNKKNPTNQPKNLLFLCKLLYSFPAEIYVNFFACFYEVLYALEGLASFSKKTKPPQNSATPTKEPQLNSSLM